jgi:hypothetical protein
LKDAVIGIDASHYINQHLLNQSTREALLGALGGFPFALRANIEKELQIFKNLGVGCIFVFNGLDFGKKEQRAQPQSSRSFEQAWDLYDQQQADQVVDAFSSAGMVSPSPPPSPSLPSPDEVLVTGLASLHLLHRTLSITPRTATATADTANTPGTPPPETLFKFFQRILVQNGVQFMVAPYSAAAQVSRYPWHDSGSIYKTNTSVWIALLPC